MNILEYKKLIDILPLGFAYYDGNGDLVYSNKLADKIHPNLFPKKFKNLNLKIKVVNKINSGKSIFSHDSIYYNLNIKPINKMRDGCLILARDTSNKREYVYSATHDTLTGLYNRNFFETEFEKLKVGRDFPVSIIILDLDKLKVFNDKLGHNAGDEALVKAAELIKESVRKNDIVARIGGDEFAILIPNANDFVSEKILTKVQNKIKSYNKTSKRTISVSNGYSIANSGGEMKKAFIEADKNMYMHKKCQA